MKFTSEDLMKAIGLNVGDRIKLNGRYYTIEINALSCLPVYANDTKYYNLIGLVDKDFEILPRPKRVGDLKCGEQDKITCIDCPIKSICSLCDLGCRNTLYEFLEDYKNHHKESFDQEIYDLLKARLDKEVE